MKWPVSIVLYKIYFAAYLGVLACTDRRGMHLFQLRTDTG